MILLASLKEDHPWFAKDFRYVAPKQEDSDGPPEFENPDGFFDNLPPVKKQRKKVPMIESISKQQRLKKQLEKLEKRQSRVIDKIGLQKAKLAAQIALDEEEVLELNSLEESNKKLGGL